MNKSDRDYLLEMIVSKCYKYGNFLLSSGNLSSHYVNCKPVTLSAKGLLLISRLFLKKIEFDVRSVAGLSLGANPLVSGVSLISKLEFKRNLNALIVRKKVKNYGTQDGIEGPLPPSESKITVLEDVISTGKSSMKVVNQLRLVGYKVNAVIAVVNREQEESADLFKSENVNVFSLFTLKEIIDRFHNYHEAVLMDS